MTNNQEYKEGHIGVEGATCAFRLVRILHSGQRAAFHRQYSCLYIRHVKGSVSIFNFIQSMLVAVIGKCTYFIILGHCFFEDRLTIVEIPSSLPCHQTMPLSRIPLFLRPSRLCLPRSSRPCCELESPLCPHKGTLPFVSCPSHCATPLLMPAITGI